MLLELWAFGIFEFKLLRWFSGVQQQVLRAAIDDCSCLVV
jgi:hypothetical protein